MKEELQGMIDRFCLDAEIHPPVPYEKVPCLYAGSDIVVFPSIWPEPFGRIAIEAIAAGKPVIGSAIGGIKETIAASSGILVAPGNVEELRKAIIAANEVAHKDGGKYVEQRYGEQVITKKIIGFYEKILNSG